MCRYLIISLISLVLLNCKDIKSESKELQNINKGIVLLSPPINTNSKNVEIVFCLDATGSMSGLIGTAKEKIWDIVSELSQSTDVDTLQMGMIFYRDRGDQFITKQISLTTDLDAVYSELLEMQANGGGDSPESVNQALNEAVSKMKWSSNENTYRTIFVVGDCPPHMDYQDDVHYTESCKKAVEKKILINTIKLGMGCSDAVPHFEKMANCSNGEFLQLDQNATDYVIETPYDESINKVSREIDDSRLYYGNEEEQKLNYAKKVKSMEVYDKGTSTANSARAAYKSSKSGEKSWMGTKEIVKDFENGKVRLTDIKEEELPTSLKGKTVKEKESILNELLTKRSNGILKLKELTAKRKFFIEQKSKEKSNKDSLPFSKEVIKIMKKQSN